MSALVHAIPVIESQTRRRVVLIGGLAVVCRLTRAYRATSDLDTVNRRRGGEAAQLELLIAHGATASGVSGALVATPVGEVQVDILEVTDADLDPLPTDPNDRLHVMSHAWAAATASDVVLRAAGTPDRTVAVAEPGPLIAMKLQSVMNREAKKEATDLLDIVRLVLDPVAGPVAREQLATAHGRLREDALLHASLWFDARIRRTLRTVRAVPEGLEVQLDDLHLVGELIQGSLR
jgi:hypothetical protein